MFSLLRTTTPRLSTGFQYNGVAVATRAFRTTPVALKKQSKQQAKNKAPAPPSEEDEELDGKKGRGKSRGVFTSELVPASQSKVSPEAKEECDKIKKKMHNCVEYYRKETALLESRALGRVTPAILDNVKVPLPEMGAVKLTDVATIGVKEGTVLVVTAFDEHNLKAIEKAIYGAEIPHCVPHRVDARTLRIPMPKPTLEARSQFVKQGSKESEDAKVKIRAAGTAGLKNLTKLGFEKRSPELVVIQNLTNKATAEVDQILTRLRKELGS